MAFPTETVYGLGADATNDAAVRSVFEAKGRPADNPLIVHIAELHQLENYSKDVSDKGRKLAETFWPGPLTLVVKRTNIISSLVAAGLDSVAIRMPDHPVPLALIASLGRGMVGPSANLSGRPSPTLPAHVITDLGGRIDAIIDSGPTLIGVESTVIDITTEPPLILRQGGLTREEIELVIGPVSLSQDRDSLKKSPGTQYRHYAPRARVMLTPEGDIPEIIRLRSELLAQRLLVGCIVQRKLAGSLPQNDSTIVWDGGLEEFSRILFGALRELDETGVDVIIVEGVKEIGLGAAIMDRLRRAAQT